MDAAADEVNDRRCDDVEQKHDEKRRPIELCKQRKRKGHDAENHQIGAADETNPGELSHFIYSIGLRPLLP